MYFSAKESTNNLSIHGVRITMYQSVKIKDSSVNLNERRLNTPMEICVMRASVSVQIIA